MRYASLLFLFASPAFADDKADFLADYHQAAVKLKDRYQSLSAQYVMTSDGPEVTFKEEGEARFSFEHFLARSSSAWHEAGNKLVGKSEELVIGRNTKYTFILSGGKLVKTNVNNDAVRPLFELNAPYCDHLHRETYEDLVKKGIATVESYDAGKRKLVYWSMRPDLETAKKSTKVKTSIAFTEDWSVEVLTTEDYGATSVDSFAEKRLTYKGGLLSGFTEWGYYDDVLKLKRTGHVELAPAEHLPLTAFRLTAFGLPEPAGVTWPAPIPYYYWLLGAGGVLVVGLSIFSRRRAA